MFVSCPVISAKGTNEWVWYLLYLRCLCVVPVISAQGTDEWVSHLLYLICLHVVLLSQPNVQMNAFGICYILDVCVLTCYLSTRYRLTGLASGIS